MRPLTILFLFLAPIAQADTNLDRDCLVGFLDSGADHLTLGEMRERCSGPESTAPARVEQAGGVEARLKAEREAAARPFSILAHKPNYVLVAYNAEEWSPAQIRVPQNAPEYKNDNYEMQFQFSFKVPLAVDLLGGRMDLFGAYTNRSFWQMFNSDYSEPFRETNHEPEVWAQFRNNWEFLGFTNVINAVGWVHQSNGRADPISRGWNRVYANVIFERDDLVFSFKPWIWVAKDKANSDNPDIDEYMGHGEFRALWQKRGHVLSLMSRNQLESGFERGAVEAGWSFPVFGYPYLKGYVQYFYGYGESLIDYDQKVNRIGLGISFTDWLD